MRGWIRDDFGLDVTELAQIRHGADAVAQQLGQTFPWYENATGRLEIYNRVKLWRVIAGDDPYDPDYWGTRVSNRPRRVVAQRSLNPHAAKKELA